MDLLQNIYGRSVGCDTSINYDSVVLEKFRCTSCEIPQSGFVESNLLSCCFAKKPTYGHMLATFCENGTVITLNTKLLKSKPSGYYHVSKAHNETVFSAAWSEIDMKLVTVSSDRSGSVKLWDVSEAGTLQFLNTFSIHKRSVKTACFKPQSNNVFATGSRDGNVYIWDARARTASPEQHILNCHPTVHKKNESASVTWLTFLDEIKLITCGDTDTNINIWDLRKTYLRTMKRPIPSQQLHSPKKDSIKGYSHMMLDENGTRLYANSLYDIIYCFNVATFSSVPVSAYTGRSHASFYDKISLSPSGKYVAKTNYQEKKILMWRTNLPGDPVVELGGDLQGLSDVSWCPEDETMIASSSDHPFPWIWTIPAADDAAQAKYEEELSWVETSSTNADNNEVYSGPHSYGKRLNVKNWKNKRLSAMAISFSRAKYPDTEILSTLTLPNSIVDGFQNHTCKPIEKHRKKLTNWFTEHTDKSQKLVVEAPLKAIEKRKAPSPASPGHGKMKRIKLQVLSTKGAKKRKSSLGLSPGNSLDKYFKRTNENIDNANASVV